MSDKLTSLEALAEKLRRLRPPSIHSLIVSLESAEEYREFVEVVREFTPEHEREILAGDTPATQMMHFASHFEDRYFPLDYYVRDGMVESYYELTRAVPIICLGLSYDDYYNIITDGNLGYQMLVFLVEEEPEYREELTEAISEKIPRDILEQATPLDQGTACQIFQTDGPYPGIAWWVRILGSDTGNLFHDICSEDYACQNVQTFEWIRGEVEELTLQWQRAEVINNQVSEAASWLEEKPVEHFQEVLNFIKEKLA